MAERAVYLTSLLEYLIEMLDSPPSHYERAKERYESLGAWLGRDGSRVGPYNPAIYPQGSFRCGTVIRPLLTTEEYDLDLVCQLDLPKETVSQKQVKDLVGHEMHTYTEAHGMNSGPVEKRRCWRVEYADDVRFHIDVLPAVPEGNEFVAFLVRLGVPESFAAHAVAITDRHHPGFADIGGEWPRSNPRGYAEWFESRMTMAARARMQELVAEGRYASVDDVPAYEWKTPLQRAIQILKRHRDVMFKDDQEHKPISIIINTLAGRAYRGENDVYEALLRITEEMPGLVRDEVPRVPNPVDPAEDFADKWATDAALEKNFWAWHTQVQVDLGRLARGADADEIANVVRRGLGVTLAGGRMAELFGSEGRVKASAQRSARTVQIKKDAPKPWGCGR